MAWRDDKARATLIREAAGSVQPGKTPADLCRASVRPHQPRGSCQLRCPVPGLPGGTGLGTRATAYDGQCRYPRDQSDHAGRARDFRARSSQRQHALPVRFDHGGARRAGYRSRAGRPPDHRRGARRARQTAAFLRRNAARGRQGRARKPDPFPHRPSRLRRRPPEADRRPCQDAQRRARLRYRLARHACPRRGSDQDPQLQSAAAADRRRRRSQPVPAMAVRR